MTLDWTSDYSDWLYERVPFKEGKPLKWITCGVKEGEELLGVASLFNWVPGHIVFFGGAGSHPRWMSRQLIKDILEFGFDKINAQKMVAYTNPENDRTRKILEQFGFEHTDTIKDGFGQGKDKLVYVLNRSVAKQWLERLGS